MKSLKLKDPFPGVGGASAAFLPSSGCVIDIGAITERSAEFERTDDIEWSVGVGDDGGGNN